jgi:membrane-anchored protein YejM (alkaline phosphatase superfamily)
MNNAIIYSITGIYIVIMIGFTIIAYAALNKVHKDHSHFLPVILHESNFLKLATVLGIIASATYLALANQLTEGVVAILSGIAGYVLAGVGKAEKKEKN